MPHSVINKQMLDSGIAVTCTLNTINMGLIFDENILKPSGHSVKVKVHIFDIALLRESPPQKRSGMARVLKGSHSFTCKPTRSSAIGMSHTCLCLPSYSWYSFTDPGGMED